MSDQKKYLSIEDIESVDDIRYHEATAWGGTLRFASLSAEEMLEFVEDNEGPARKTAGARLLSKSIVDDAGARIGTEKSVQMFLKKDAGTVSRLVGEVLQLNGLLIVDGVSQAKNDSSGVVSGGLPTVLH